MATSLLPFRATVAARRDVGRQHVGRKCAPARAVSRVALRPWAAPVLRREAVLARALSRDDDEDSFDEDDDTDIRCELDR